MKKVVFPILVVALIVLGFVACNKGVSQKESRASSSPTIVAATPTPTPRPQAQTPVGVATSTPQPIVRPTPTLTPTPIPAPRIVRGSQNDPYAYEVLVYQGGSQDPSNVLGAPDNEFLSLGGEGSKLEVKVGRLLNGPGSDLRVVECGKGCNYPGNPQNEPYDVFVSTREGFVFLGRGNGITEFDLDSIGVATTETVRIVDRGKKGGGTPGADIDALVALQSIPTPISIPVTPTPAVVPIVPDMQKNLLFRNETKNMPVVVLPPKVWSETKAVMRFKFERGGKSVAKSRGLRIWIDTAAKKGVKEGDAFDYHTEEQVQSVFATDANAENACFDKIMAQVFLVEKSVETWADKDQLLAENFCVENPVWLTTPVYDQTRGTIIAEVYSKSRQVQRAAPELTCPKFEYTSTMSFWVGKIKEEIAKGGSFEIHQGPISIEVEVKPKSPADRNRLEECVLKVK